jgi:hypothetical protein
LHICQTHNCFLQGHAKPLEFIKTSQKNRNNKKNKNQQKKPKKRRVKNNSFAIFRNINKTSQKPQSKSQFIVFLMTRRNKTKQNKTKQNKTKQNKTKQNKTKQKAKNKNKTKTKYTFCMWIVEFREIKTKFWKQFHQSPGHTIPVK